PNALRRNLNQLIIVDEFHRLLKGMLDRRSQQNVFISTGSTDVSQLLAFGRVNNQIVIAAVQTNHHTFVNFYVRLDEQTAKLLQCTQCVTQRLAGNHGHQHTVFAGSQLALFGRTVVIKHVVHHTGTGSQAHEHGAETDQTTSRNLESQTYTA